MRNDLAAVVRRSAQALERHLRRARRGQPRAVHQARVASRRLREALPVAFAAAPRLRRANLPRGARRVARALGAVREMDVTLRELDAGELAHAWEAAVVERVRRSLTAERDRRLAHLDERLDHVDARRLADRASALADGCDRAEAAGWRGPLAARMRKRAKAFGAALRSAGTLYAPASIHEVRIAGKKLRYTLELAHAAAGAPVGRHIAALARLQDLLGRLHDLQVLQEHVRVVAADGAADLRLSAQLEVLPRDLESECRLLHARFLARLDAWRRVADLAGRQIPVTIAARRPARMLEAGRTASRPLARATA